MLHSLRSLTTLSLRFYSDLSHLYCPRDGQRVLPVDEHFAGLLLTQINQRPFTHVDGVLSLRPVLLAANNDGPRSEGPEQGRNLVYYSMPCLLSVLSGGIEQCYIGRDTFARRWEPSQFALRGIAFRKGKGIERLNPVVHLLLLANHDDHFLLTLLTLLTLLIARNKPTRALRTVEQSKATKTKRKTRLLEWCSL